MSSNIGKQRVNFASIKNPLPYPDFLEVQLKSFQDFLQLDTPPEKRKNEGLYKVFAENFPIADTRNNFCPRIFGLLHRSAEIYYRRMYRKRFNIQRSFKGKAEVVLYRSRS